MYIHPTNHPVGFGHMGDIQSAPRFGGMARVEEDPLTPVWRSACYLNGGDPPDSKLLWQTTNNLLATQRAADNVPASADAALDAQIFNTTTTGATSIVVTLTGQSGWWVEDDGTTVYAETLAHNPSKAIRFTLLNWAGFGGVTQIDGHGSKLTGPLPSFANYAAMTVFRMYDNALSGALPSFADCTSLATMSFRGNAFTGELPSFNACTALASFQCYTNGFSGVIPDFSACTSLASSGFLCHDNAFTGYTVGSLATQLSLTHLYLKDNSLGETEIDDIFTDCVTNLGSKANCSLKLENNTAPSDYDDRDTLVAAGWTVTVD